MSAFSHNAFSPNAFSPNAFAMTGGGQALNLLIVFPTVTVSMVSDIKKSAKVSNTFSVCSRMYGPITKETCFHGV